MIYNVLLVDDEERILQGLAQVIRWEQCGFRIAGTASNGEEALALMERTDFHVLFTDVRMPVMDGIRLIGRALELRPEMKAVIISGYNDFEYAQKAIMLGASGYILKPMRHDEIYQALGKIKKQLDAGRTETADERQHFEKLLRDTVLYDSRESAKALNEAEQASGATDDNACYLLLVREFDLGNVLAVSAALDEIVPRLFGDADAYVLKNDHDHILLLDRVPGSWDMQRLSRLLLAELTEQSRPFTRDSMLMLTAAGPAARLAESHKLYHEALDNLRYTFHHRQGIVTIDRSLLPASPPEPQDLAEIVNRIILALSLEQVDEALDELLHRLEAFPLPAEDIRFLVRSLLGAIRSGSLRHLPEHAGPDAESGEPLNRIRTFDRLREYLTACIVPIHHLLQQYNINFYARIVQLIRQYVEEHYRETIRLEDVAKYVSVSVSYFCYIFKKETGLTFGDYLIGFRLERARQLFLDKGLKVYEAAEQVGYPDVRHFTKLFKRKYGFTPGDLKK